MVIYSDNVGSTMIEKNKRKTKTKKQYGGPRKEENKLTDSDPSGGKQY